MMHAPTPLRPIGTRPDQDFAWLQNVETMVCELQNLNKPVVQLYELDKLLHGNSETSTVPIGL